MTGAHGAWQMAAEMHRPRDITVAVQALAAQGLGRNDIADTLRIGVAAVEQALREGSRQ